jgi:hypothetical protein
MTKKERRMPKKKENLTEGYLNAVLDALPKRMDGDEIAALTLVIWLRYMDDMPTVMDHLTRSVYTCGNYFGLTDSTVSRALIATAKMRMDDDLPSGRMQ